MERRQFTREFKLEAVRLIKQRGVSYAQASRLKKLTVVNYSSGASRLWEIKNGDEKAFNIVRCLICFRYWAPKGDVSSGAADLLSGAV
jgi:hypothetical protein